MKRTIVIVTILAVMLVGTGYHAPTYAAEHAALFAQGHPNCAGVTAETPSTPECDALIAARPYPNVTPLPVDFGVLSGVSFIRFNTRQVPLYNKPNGTQVDTLSAGYTYVAVRQISDNFAEVRPGRWVDLSIARFARPSTFTGVMINGLDMPFAWVLRPTRPPEPEAARAAASSAVTNWSTSTRPSTSAVGTGT
jgi:hypothetical protein